MIISGFAKSEDIDKLMSHQIIVGYLKKPFEIPELISNIKNILDLK